MKKVYVNEEVCIGCRLCEVYCQLRHALSRDPVKAFKRETPRPLPRLRVEEKGVVSLSVRCQHCEAAPCLYACLTGAICRDPVEGVVKVDPEKCIGCWTCLLVCPLGAIKQDIAGNRVVKCDLCQGEEVPVCVANCPNEALVYMDTEEVSHNVGGRAVASTLMDSKIN
jgi:carbon-monoxide dehydrogenase iron sulfur subunit